MAFLESFLVPYGTSIFANFSTNKIKDLMGRINGNNKALQKLFVGSMLKSLESAKKATNEKKDGLFSQLIDVIKKNEIKLFVSIQQICKKEKKNFLNIIKDDKENSFIKSVFNAYNINISEIKDNSIYQNILDNLMSNYKISFLNYVSKDEAVILTFHEILKMDEVLEIQKQILSLLTELNLTQNKKFLTNIPSNHLFLGREDDLKKIKQNLKTKKQLLLLNGIGGIGKTSLVIEYINTYKDEYDHIAFIELKNEIKESILSVIGSNFVLNAQTQDERFNELLVELENLHGKNLFVIDNIKTQEDFEVIKSLSSNFDLLITSRVKFRGITNYQVEKLSKEKSKELFLEYYKTDEDIDNLLKYLDYHTLFIKFTAQTLANTRVHSIKDLEIKFENGEFGDITNNLEEKSFNLYLNELFQLNELDTQEIYLLQRLSLFPSIEIEFEKLKDFLCIKDEDIEKFDVSLTRLSKLGWLIKNKNTFKLHQIIKEFLLLNHKITYSMCEDIIDYLFKKIDPRFNNNYIDTFKYIDFSISIVDNINEKTEKIGMLFSNISLIYKDMGEYNKAIDYNTRALKLAEEIPENKFRNIPTCNSNLSDIYFKMNDFDEALKYQEKALKAREKNLLDLKPELISNNNQVSIGFLKILKNDIIESYIGISAVYSALWSKHRVLEYFEKTVIYQDKSLKLIKEIYKEKDQKFIGYYNNTAMFYYDMLNHGYDEKISKLFLEKSLSNQKKAIEIAESIYGEKNLHTLMFYMNMSKILIVVPDMKNAKIFIDKSLRYLPLEHAAFDYITGMKQFIDSKL